MATSIRLSSVFVTDQDAALDWYVNVLGMEVHTDVDLGFMRWLTVCAPGDRSRELLLERPGAPSMDEATAEQVRGLLSKGAMAGWFALAVDDPYAEFERLKAAGVDLTDEISEKDYGVDFGIRDPFGNRIRIGKMTGS
ncbi:MAG: VOC family protein [Thermoanaerobacterales bacterium]|nr:VOC family protein [Thermoanaerobacterales bacterium]